MVFNPVISKKNISIRAVARVRQVLRVQNFKGCPTCLTLVLAPVGHLSYTP